MTRTAGLTARDIVATLAMQPHPEGGWYVETFRDAAGGARGHSTAIYYLLEKGQRSHWHRVVDAAEAWHWHAGSALTLRLSPDGRSVIEHRLGIDLAAGERPQAIVPAGWWQAAEPVGDFSLVGCTVAPGFTFSSFEMAPPGWSPSGSE
jgi:predicted cupin superfamily sugar epimerase